MRYWASSQDARDGQQSGSSYLLAMNKGFFYSIYCWIKQAQME